MADRKPEPAGSLVASGYLLAAGPGIPGAPAAGATAAGPSASGGPAAGAQEDAEAAGILPLMRARREWVMDSTPPAQLRWAPLPPEGERHSYPDAEAARDPVPAQVHPGDRSSTRKVQSVPSGAAQLQ